ncbi:Adenylate-forming reductase Nps10 [Fulvia fulva]|uniref:Adenylate-forming reductase Nps10 n=1 Tax=Passalora fulva TaxID=5499 RepID=A0A9Q8PKI7_PASFU|nr:Adenylate-forming reductase Nps10 [Fulvia fulva]KAK4611750.1 Adenylate-forming reductase Nps10 [Fulvia fulva]UJO24064.1 Adenylate-forming reductase Nps10 [Fulvia fulva]WPV21510.1 Adenylate-forming reductase Nps10 [Fulvia fulva]WPV35819.1 Adenylate-forming reductase Nps10 [Fulvia fulva]
METNYFVCTLGQAAVLKERDASCRNHSKNIPHFLETQAKDYPDLPAVGFYAPSTTDPWRSHVLTFQDVYNGSCVVAETITERVKIEDRQTVALLCPSSSGFLFTWLALMRLGHPVLLIAPQCSPGAVAELCKQCEVEHIFRDEMYEELARGAADVSEGLRLQPLPFYEGVGPFEVVKHTRKRDRIVDGMSEHDVAYLHHTSGTSTGIPKPIPQTHRVGAGVYARFDGTQSATFTTTPLYHGGIADLFRAWTSNAMIWLFPGKELPITAMNVVKCLEAAEESRAPPVKYFSSVPYVLQMTASDDRGLAELQEMDVVGVGGAALPAEVGDELVRKDVNLVSRFGSAECGFLMSSHREYEKDKEWQYLRPGEAVKQLKFEERDAGLHELVILSGWPHMSKTNREDGSFVTADLFKLHESIPNAWRYHSRADAQLTLITGKKFDPSPLEASIAASSELLNDVLIFGNGKPYPGALLFRSEIGKDTSDDDVTARLAPTVEKLNQESQSHARIPRNMLIPLPHSSSAVEKSSKGTILRNKAEERFAEIIEGAYENVSVSEEDVPDEKVASTIQDIVKTIVSPGLGSKKELGPETDLFAYGVDSVACVQIRHAVSKLFPEDSRSLPLTVVQDSGTIQRLTDLVLRIRHGDTAQTDSEDDQTKLMKDLVNQYSHIDGSIDISQLPRTPPRSPGNKGLTVVLTGPTGSLGSHVLNQLLASSVVAHIHLLLRGATEHAARERVRRAMSSRKLEVPADIDSKTSVHTCTLSEPQLGLSKEAYARLARDVDVIYHLAWAVDFTLSLRGFKQHFAGLQALLDLSLAHSKAGGSEGRPAQLVFCSSTASMASFPEHNKGHPIPERILDDPAVSGAIGYSRSKWVAENICLRAARSHPELEGNMSVIRVGQLSGDAVHGIWNASEAYPLMLSSTNVTNCLPDLPGESVAWLPVDLAARTFLDLLDAKSQATRRNSQSPAVNVYHVLSSDTSSTTWQMLLSWLQGDMNFDIVSAGEWLGRLERLQVSQNDGERRHPSLKLLDFWQKAYSTPTEPRGSEKTVATYEHDRTKSAMPSLGDLTPVNEKYARKLGAWVRENV